VGTFSRISGRDGAHPASTTSFLKGVALPAELEIRGDLGRACAGASILILAAPSQYMRSLLERLKPLPRAGDLIYLNVAKGIEVGCASG